MRKESIKQLIPGLCRVQEGYRHSLDPQRHARSQRHYGDGEIYGF